MNKKQQYDVMMSGNIALLASVNFWGLPLSYRSHKVLDIKVLPVGFTGGKPKDQMTQTG